MNKKTVGRILIVVGLILAILSRIGTTAQKQAAGLDKPRSEYEYDEEGREIRHNRLDENGAVIYVEDYTYDENGLLIHVLRTDPKGAEIYTIDKEYDADGKLLRDVYSDGSVVDYTEE